MSTEDDLRQRVVRLINLGVSQKVMAAHMGVSESWLSRWRRRETHGITTAAMDAFYEYERELRSGPETVPEQEVRRNGTTNASVDFPETERRTGHDRRTAADVKGTKSHRS